MPKMKLEGSFVALITPFNADGAVDFGAFRTLLDFHERHGTAAVLIMGSTGETSLLSPEEKKRIIVETAKMKRGNMPIFFGSKPSRPIHSKTNSPTSASRPAGLSMLHRSNVSCTNSSVSIK